MAKDKGDEAMAALLEGLRQIIESDQEMQIQGAGVSPLGQPYMGLTPAGPLPGVKINMAPSLGALIGKG